MADTTTEISTPPPSRQPRVPRQTTAIAASDLIIWAVALVLAQTFHERNPFSGSSIALITIAMAIQFAIGYATGLYRGRFRLFSFDEAGAVAITAGATGAFVIAVEHLGENAPRAGQIIVLSTSLAVCLMFGHRYVRRIRADRRRAAATTDRIPVVVYGAGDGGYRAIAAMQAVRSSAYRPVALVDDDPTLRRRRIGGIKVEGTGDDLAPIAERHGARAVLLAMPSATGEELRPLHALVRETGLETLVMPPVQRLVGEGSPREFMCYRDEDVLNRRVVEIDSASVRELVSGSTVLVTGAGGSIGSELVRQLAGLGAASLVALDHDDSLLHHVLASLPADQRPACTAVLADIRDIDRLNEVLGHHRPSVVFHAAALKHVPALEGAPSEGWKTNVLGSANVLEASERAGVQRVVNISTDKAADPQNVLGYSKRIAERLTAASAVRTGRPYVSVRFGNVIGSRGSAIETFERQIAAGGPVTITHPDVTRYFMAVREAVRLTMQAAAIGRPGEALVLDMGTPVRVLDVAQQLIERSGHGIEITFTGLRPGEKMHEVLLGDGETSGRPLHPMIDHVTVPPLFLGDAIDTCAARGLGPSSIAGLAAIAFSSPTIGRATLQPHGSGQRTGSSLRRTP